MDEIVHDTILDIIMEEIEEVNVEQLAVRGDNGNVVANGEDDEDEDIDYALT